MFAGNSMLMPKAVTGNPQAFNKGFLNGPGPSAGPFIITTVDRGAQRIVLTRNPKWWGTPPLLDSITYTVLDDAATIPALQNNAIDSVGLASLDELNIARRTAGIAIRRTPAPNWYHLTFNGARGVDPVRSGAADRGRQGHRPPGDRGDHAARPGRQPGAAEQPHLPGRPGGLPGQQHRLRPRGGQTRTRCAGLAFNGQFREKDGRRLTIRDVFYDGRAPARSARSRRTTWRRSASASS